MIKLPHQTILTRDVDSLGTYIGIVPGLVQRPNALNAKSPIIEQETVEAPNNSL